MLAFFALKVLQIILWVVDWLVRVATGYSLTLGSKRERSRSEKYQASAHIVKVLLRAQLNEEWDHYNLSENGFEPNSNLLLLHCEYGHPRCVLQDNVSLFGVSKDTVYFAVVPPQLNVYSSDTHPFSFQGQFKHLTHLVSMPIASFHRLAAEIGEPSSKVIMLFSTGRCGSTLVAQCFEALLDTRAISEPAPLYQASWLFNRGAISDEEQRKIIWSIIVVLCKEVTGVNRILIKPSSNCCTLIGCINTTCRFVQHVFMYRHPVNYMLSCASIFKADPTCTRDWIDQTTPPAHRTGDCEWRPRENFINQTGSVFQITTRHWAVICKCYMEYRKKGVVIKAIGYEQLVSNPYETMSSLFRYLGIPQALTSCALTAMEKTDSQARSFVSRDKLRRYKANCLTQDELREVDGVLQTFGFPTVSEFTPELFE